MVCTPGALAFDLPLPLEPVPAFLGAIVVGRHPETLMGFIQVQELRQQGKHAQRTENTPGVHSSKCFIKRKLKMNLFIWHIVLEVGRTVQVISDCFMSSFGY